MKSEIPLNDLTFPTYFTTDYYNKVDGKRNIQKLLEASLSATIINHLSSLGFRYPLHLHFATYQLNFSAPFGNCLTFYFSFDLSVY